MTDEHKREKAKDISSLRKVCTPKPLTGGDLDAFFVETDAARDPYVNTREVIDLALDGEDHSVLLYGHPGCGKSTEINKFLVERTGKYLPVRFSVLEEMTPTNTSAEDLILVAIERLLQTARDERIQIEDQRLKMVYEWFSEITREKGTRKELGATAGAGVDTSHSFFDKLMGLFVTIKGEVKYNSYSEETSVFMLRRRPADLLDRANELFRGMASAMLEKGDPRKLLVVVEDMDKLDLKQARGIYVENSNLLVGMHVRTLYTIPIYLFHSPDANQFKSKFTRCLALPMIMTWDPTPGSERPAGFEKVKEVVLKRIEVNLIEEEALDELVARTGGVLRHVFEVLQIVSTMLEKTVPITRSQIDYGLRQVRKDLWQMIALPLEPVPGAPQTLDELYQRLSQYARGQIGGEKSPCNPDSINQILLKSCALIEYNGEGWVGVHPLVVESLEKQGRLKRDGS